MLGFPRRLTAIVAVAAMLVAACSPTENLRGPSPVAKPTDQARQTIAVRRGTIAETVKATGRITALNETPAFFRTAGRVRTLGVEVGQPIKQGDVIAELETGQLGVQIEIARVNLQIADMRAAQFAQASGDASVQVAAANIAKAEADHAKAVADLEGRRATSGGDVGVWNAAVASAQAKLAAANSPAQPAEVAAAEQAVTAAQAGLNKAQLELQKAKAGYTPEEIRTQEHAIEAAKNAIYAEQVARDAARGRSDGAGTAAGDARISAAQAALDAANDRLKVLKAGGKPEDVAVAQKNVEAAQALLDASQAKLEAIKAGPKPEDVAVAKSAVEEAAARANQARTVLAGVPASIDAAKSAVDAAKAAVDLARAQYDQRLGELKAANGKSVDTAVAEKQLDIARLNLKALEQQIDDSRIRAPFDGVVSQLAIKAGDQVQAYAPIGTFADPSKLAVTVDIPVTDVAKVNLGQDATLTFDALGGRSLTEKVVGVPTLIGNGTGLASTSAGETRPVRIGLTQPPTGLGLGVGVAVSIVTRQRDNVLIVPSAAVKRFGGRKLVQVVGADGRRRDVEVETGIASDSDVEIIDGLTEGQSVVGA